MRSLSEEFMAEFSEYINWGVIAPKKRSENFIRKFKNKFNWERLITSRAASAVSNEIIKECCPQERVVWVVLSDDKEIPYWCDDYHLEHRLFSLGKQYWICGFLYEVAEVSCDNKVFYVELVQY